MKTILPLEQTDLSRAYQLEQLCHITPWSEKTFQSNQGERYLNLKIIQNDEFAGFAICQTVLDEATLFNIAIHPNFRRQQLATHLLTALIRQLKDRQVSTLWLEVRESNKAAISLYLQLGFNEITVRKNYYPKKDSSQKEDAIIMACTLI